MRMRLWNAAGIAIVLCASTAAGADFQLAEGASIVGGWRLRTEASDSPRDLPEGDGERRGRRGGGGRYRRGRGGAGGARGVGTRDPEEVRRRMQAIRDLMAPPEQMTITRTDSLIIITAGDGRTTRLSADGKKFKDESTGLDRKTTWENGNLVTEITGSAGKMIETYAVDAERAQLVVTLRFDNSRQPNGRVVRHVYDRQQAQ
jgi:hypothetical protein